MVACYVIYWRTSMEIIEITEYKNGRVRIQLETGISFVLYKKEAASFGFKEGDFITEEIWQEIRNEILIKRARKRVMYLLQKKDHTEKQLRDKLKGNEYPEDVIEDSIAYVKSFHYVDDGRYAANYVHYHQESKSMMQLKMDLQQKGVSKEEIDRAFEEELQVSQEDVIMKYLQKKGYDSKQADDGDRRRVCQFLLRKGFKSSDILRCMNVSEFA